MPNKKLCINFKNRQVYKVEVQLLFNFKVQRSITQIFVLPL